MTALKHLFLDELAVRYDAEKRLVVAMPEMIKAATCTQLQKLIQMHLKETAGQVKTLERSFRSFGERPREQECEVIVGVLRESGAIAASKQGWPVLNPALISFAQMLEHYGIATYGCLRDWARLLGNPEAAGLRLEMLVEEKGANHAFSEVGTADASCNGNDPESMNGQSGHPSVVSQATPPRAGAAVRQTSSRHE